MALAAAVTLALSACTSGDGGPAKPTIALFDSGTVAGALAGLDRLEADGYRTTVIDAADPAKWDQLLISASRRYDIVAVGSDLADALNAVAARYPDQHYLLIDGAITANNIVSLAFRDNEAGFLAGVLAGLVTTRPDQFGRAQGTGDVAFAGLLDDPVTAAYGAGFAAGVHAVDPMIEVQAVYLADAADEAGAYDLAFGLFTANGADVVSHAAGAAGLGVLRAAHDLGRYGIGAGVNQNDTAPGYILASVVKTTDRAFEDAVRALDDGSLVWGETVSLGLAEEAITLVYDGNTGIVPEAIQADIAAFAQKVVDWEIQVPAQ